MGVCKSRYWHWGTTINSLNNLYQYNAYNQLRCIAIIRCLLEVYFFTVMR